MGKGSKQRPTDAVKFGSNWERIFNKGSDPLYESENPLERPFDMWSHVCQKDGGKILTAKHQACNWCGIKEDGSLD